MTHQITILPSGRQFNAGAAEPILFSAIGARVSVPYGCRSGICGVCRATVMQGTFTGGRAGEVPGEVLLCTAHATSDMTIACRDVASAATVKEFPARIDSIDHPAADVARVRMKVPRQARFSYAAGQYVEIQIGDGATRCYSLATPPDPLAQQIELHVRLVPGGAFSGRFFGDLAPGDVLHLRAPHGSFAMDLADTRPAVLVVTGTGFAPAKALVETAIAAGSRRPMALYWGGRRPEDLYMADLCRRWEALLNLRFVPVLSAAGEDWQEGHRGYVQDAVLADCPDLSGHEVFACGGAAMVEAARSRFMHRGGLSASAFHADVFLTQADRMARSSARMCDTV